MPSKALAVPPPVEPMLAKIADDLPHDGDFLFEPKWDGFRAIVFRGPGKDDVYIQSRDLRPLDRYFPELHDVFIAQLPVGAVGELLEVVGVALEVDQHRARPVDDDVRRRRAHLELARREMGREERDL